MDACKKNGIIGIPGMELTTAEDIHTVCLFESLEAALDFDSEIEKRRILIPSRPDVFGDQLILDGEDNLLGREEHLLINATTLSLPEVPPLCESYGGICYPAHIDRESNGVIAVLGAFPVEPRFKFAELHDGALMEDYCEKIGFKKEQFIVSSDAHYLWDIKEQSDYFTLGAEGCGDEVRKRLFEFLRGAR